MGKEGQVPLTGMDALIESVLETDTKKIDDADKVKRALAELERDKEHRKRVVNAFLSGFHSKIIDEGSYVQEDDNNGPINGKENDDFGASFRDVEEGICVDHVWGKYSSGKYPRVDIWISSDVTPQESVAFDYDIAVQGEEVMSGKIDFLPQHHFDLIQQVIIDAGRSLFSPK
jgi:hypothetical protein